MGIKRGSVYVKAYMILKHTTTLIDNTQNKQSFMGLFMSTSRQQNNTANIR
ncbi:hypothetical protein YC2023_021543 [Brassica napus]